MKRFLFYCLFLFFFISCQKDKHSTVLIKGTLLQSSSNPVPVADYKLSFYQGGSNAIIIGTSSSTADFTTNTNGYFECKFPLGDGFFIAIPTRNTSPLSVSGGKNAGVQLGWYDVPARDTDLHVMYLYKKVQTAVLQLLTDTALLPSDTIEVYSQTIAGSYYKLITGRSIPAATATAFDTIANKISTSYSLQNKMYNADISVFVTRNGIKQNPYYGLESSGDEERKTYLLSIK